MKWFRVRTSDGRIVGVSEMSQAVAEMNLGEGEILLPHDPGVSPRTDRWIEEAWVTGDPDPGPEQDPRFMQTSGYDLAAQVETLTKVIQSLVALPELAAAVPEDVAGEFSDMSGRIADLRDEYPIPGPDAEI